MQNTSIYELQDTLKKIHAACASSLDKNPVPSPNRTENVPNKLPYQFSILVSIEIFLSSKHFNYFLDNKRTLDRPSLDAVDRLKTSFERVSIRKRTTSTLSDDPTNLRALFEALDDVDKTTKTFWISLGPPVDYQILTAEQPWTITQAMQQPLWSKPKVMCQEFVGIEAVVSEWPKLESHLLQLHVSVQSSIQAFIIEREGRLQLSQESVIPQRLQMAHIHAPASAQQSTAEHEGTNWADIQMFSIRTWLSSSISANPDGPNRKQRAMLALLVAYIYFYVSGTDKWPDNSVVPDVWFQSDFRLDQYRPCVALCHEQIKFSSSNQAKLANPRRPSLPALGKLLLEIWLARSLTWDEFMDYGTSDECRDDNLNPLFYAAASRCWTAQSIRLGGAFQNRTSMQEEYSLWVVRVLQYILAMYSVGEGDMFSYNMLTTSKGGIEVANDKLAPEVLESALDPGPVYHGEAYDISAERISFSRQPSSDICLLDNGKEQQVQEWQKDSAEEWYKELRQKCHKYLSGLRGKRKDTDVPRVRIAILDTGAKFDDIVRRELCGGRLQDCRSWCGENASEDGKHLKEMEDSDGHGTRSASLVFETSKQCLVYVAKIDEGRNHGDLDTPGTFRAEERIIYAIKYAVREWKVDIITMSFGFDKRSVKISDTIRDAANTGVLFFAASSNHGALKENCYPGTDTNVFGVHAMTGKGHIFELTARSRDGSENIATLGCAASAWSPSKQGTIRRYCSGSSVAAPIAAAIAGSVIEMMRCGKDSYLESRPTELRAAEEQRYDQALEALKRKDGMRVAFKKIVGDTWNDRAIGYRFLAPGKFIQEREFGRSTPIDEILYAMDTM